MARKKHESLESLTIVSADGTPRMKLTTDPKHGLPYIELLGEGGLIHHACFGLNPGDLPYFCLMRKDGTAALGMGVDEEGQPGVSAYHPTGLPAVRIQLLVSGNIEIELTDRSDNITRFRIDNPPASSPPAS